MEKYIKITHTKDKQEIEIKGISDLETLGLLRYYEKRLTIDMLTQAPVNLMTPHPAIKRD